MARESPKYSCATRPVPEPEYYLCYQARGPVPAPCRSLPLLSSVLAAEEEIEGLVTNQRATPKHSLSPDVTDVSMDRPPALR
jgi:hypothetical protein